MIELIHQTIVENQYNLEQKNANNRTLEIGTKKGLETNSRPNNRKNSTRQKTLEIFVSKLYENIISLDNYKLVNAIRSYASIG